MQAELIAFVERLQNARQHLQAMSVTDIAAALERVARRWLNRAAPERQKALAELPQRLPFSRPVCERALDALFEPITAMRLLALLDEQLGDHRALDTFVPFGQGRHRKAFGADLAFLILAGNIVGIGIWDIAFCLLCKTPVLVKPSSEEPLMSTLFTQSLAAVAPELANAIAVVPFPSEREELLDAALQQCDAVIVYGTDETVTTIKRRTPAKVRVIERGHRFSVTIVADEFADERTAELLALDVARFDQRGCLSPQVCFVITGREARDKGRDFGLKVAEALRRISVELPPNLRESEKVSMTQFRLTCEMLGATVLAASDASWTVVIWDGGREMGDGWRKAACSIRVIHIVAVSSLEEAVNTLKPLGKYLQGIAVAADERQAEWLAEKFGQMGASRICAVGQLQIPPMEWSQDGKHLIADLVRWCDLEPISLPSFESGWVDVFFGDEAQGAMVRWTLEQKGIPVSIETDVDPTDPSLPRQRLRVPAEFAEGAKQALKKMQRL